VSDRSLTPKARAIDFFTMLKDAGVRWSDDNCLRLGASLAYYAVFSIFPLLLLAVTALGFVLGHSPETRGRLLDAVASASTPEFKTLFDGTLSDMETHQTARGVGAVVGLVMLLVGASAVFSELESTLNQIWKVKPTPTSGIWRAVVTLVRGKALSFAVVIGAAVALLLSLVVSAVLSNVGKVLDGGEPATVTHPTLWLLVEAGGSAAVLTLVLAAMFRLIPQTRIEWRDVFGGALLTAILFTAIKGLLAWYLGHLGSYAAYGAVGGFLGLLTWIYLASLILFYGAELCHVYAERHGSLVGTSLEQSGGDVHGDADDPTDRSEAHVLTQPPVGSERRNEEGDEAAHAGDLTRKTQGQRKVKGDGHRERKDDGTKDDRVSHG
jgi:membrane protein